MDDDKRKIMVDYISYLCNSNLTYSSIGRNIKSVNEFLNSDFPLTRRGYKNFIQFNAIKIANNSIHKEEYEYMKKMSENRNKTRNLGFIERLQKAQEMQIDHIKKTK